MDEWTTKRTTPKGIIFSSMVWKKIQMRTGKWHRIRCNAWCERSLAWTKFNWSRLGGWSPHCFDVMTVHWNHAHCGSFPPVFGSITGASKLTESQEYQHVLKWRFAEASVQECKVWLTKVRRARAGEKIAYFSHAKLVIRERRESVSRPASAEDPSARALTASLPATAASTPDNSAPTAARGAEPEQETRLRGTNKK